MITHPGHSVSLKTKTIPVCSFQQSRDGLIWYSFRRWGGLAGRRVYARIMHGSGRKSPHRERRELSVESRVYILTSCTQSGTVSLSPIL